MFKSVLNETIRQGLLLRYKRIERIRNSPLALQQKWFQYLIQNGKRTDYGRRHNFQEIKSQSDFQKIPFSSYELLKLYIDLAKAGVPSVLWPSKTKWYAKSSGTTSGRSKYIPVTKQMLYQAHISTNWDVLSVLYKQKRDAAIFSKKGIIMTGSVEQCHDNGSMAGDVSAIMLSHIPKVAKPFYSPSIEVGLMPDWEKKIEIIISQSKDKDVGMIGGVPTWTVVMLRQLLDATGKDHVLDVWPNLNVYFHGGVGFDPYRQLFEQLIPSDKVFYLEAYNASEGYFAIQDIYGCEDMLLMLDNGVYYEFLPIGELESSQPNALTLEAVETDIDYALVISTSAGLWRYVVGDTIRFTSLSPYRIKLTGRTEQSINVFGEEVMIYNTDRALATTCEELQAKVADYTVAPVYFEENKAYGGHQWIIEFEEEPRNIEKFTELLDFNLQRVNSDYEAKRYKDLALQPLEMQVAPSGTFYRWMKSKGKIGGQNKVPRLSNSRQYIEELLLFINKNSVVHG